MMQQTWTKEARVKRAVGDPVGWCHLDTTMMIMKMMGRGVAVTRLTPTVGVSPFGPVEHSGPPEEWRSGRGAAELSWDALTPDAWTLPHGCYSRHPTPTPHSQRALLYDITG